MSNCPLIRPRIWRCWTCDRCIVWIVHCYFLFGKSQPSRPAGRPTQLHQSSKLCQFLGTTFVYHKTQKTLQRVRTRFSDALFGWLLASPPSPWWTFIISLIIAQLKIWSAIRNQDTFKNLMRIAYSPIENI